MVTYLRGSNVALFLLAFILPLVHDRRRSHYLDPGGQLCSVALSMGTSAAQSMGLALSDAGRREGAWAALFHESDRQRASVSRIMGVTASIRR